MKNKQSPEPKSNEILRTLVGSGAHGIAIEGRDDRDEMGIFVEGPDSVIGLTPDKNTVTWRTQPEGVRSGPQDIDLTLYSLRHYMRLATAGNPSILVPLFVQDSDIIHVTKLGTELRELAPSIVSLRAGHRFLGYMNSQLERMRGGGKRSRVPNRPELIEQYGYDTKFASHALRLSLQGIELMEFGRLTLPMKKDERELVRGIKLGKYNLEQALSMIEAYSYRLTRILDLKNSPLRAKPDFKAVSEWMQKAHRRSWREHLLWRNDSTSH